MKCSCDAARSVRELPIHLRANWAGVMVGLMWAIISNRTRRGGRSRYHEAVVNNTREPTTVSDTSDEAAEFRLGILRRMTFDQKAAQISELSETLRDTMIAGVRFRHPEYTQADARWATVRHLLGDDLFAAAYPDAPRRAF